MPASARPRRERIEELDELVLDDGTLFLDDENFLEAVGEGARARGLERPAHADLVQANAERAGARVVDAEFLERLPHVEIALARGGDAEARLGRVEDRAIERVDARKRAHGVHLGAVQPALLVERRVGPAQIETIRRRHEVVRQRDRHALRVDVDGRRAFDRLRDGLQRDPAAGEARHRERDDAEVEIVLHRGRIEHRDHRGDQHLLALVRARGRLAAVVVARQQHDAAVLRGARRVGVLQRVGRAVHAGTLAVPDAEHAVARRVVVEAELLRAPQRGRGEVLVDAGLEHDVMRIEVPARGDERVVVRAERRAAIAGDEARRVESRGGVALPLQERQPHQRLHAAQVDAAGRLRVLVVEGDALRVGHSRRRDVGMRGQGWRPF